MATEGAAGELRHQEANECRRLGQHRCKDLGLPLVLEHPEHERPLLALVGSPGRLSNGVPLGSGEVLLGTPEHLSLLGLEVLAEDRAELVDRGGEVVAGGGLGVSFPRQAELRDPFHRVVDLLVLALHQVEKWEHLGGSPLAQRRPHEVVLEAVVVVQHPQDQVEVSANDGRPVGVALGHLADHRPDETELAAQGDMHDEGRSGAVQPMTGGDRVGGVGSEHGRLPAWSMFREHRHADLQPSRRRLDGVSTVPADCTAAGRGATAHTATPSSPSPVGRNLGGVGWLHAPGHPPHEERERPMTATLDTITTAPAESASTTSDPTARLMKVAAVVGPLFLVAGSVAWLGGDDRAELRGILTFWAFPFIALAAYGVASRLQGRSPVGRGVVTALVAIGTCGGGAFATEINMGEHFGVERLIDQDTPSALLALGLPGLCMPLSLVVLGLLSYRHQTLPRGQALLLAAGGVLFPMSRIPQVAPLAMVADMLVLAAFAPVAFSTRRGTGATA